jgi:hypothetical protein
MTTFDPITGRADSVYFAGVPTPGLAVVEGNSGSPRKWQEKGGYALSGATIVFTGKGVAKFDVILSLLEKRDWQDWNDNVFQKLLAAPTQQGQGALVVYHPFLKQLGITQCVIEDVSIPKVDDFGVTQICISCREFRRPKIALSKPESAAALPKDPNAGAKALVGAQTALISAMREAAAK